MSFFSNADALFDQFEEEAPVKKRKQFDPTPLPEPKTNASRSSNEAPPPSVGVTVADEKKLPNLSKEELNEILNPGKKLKKATPKDDEEPQEVIQCQHDLCLPPNSGDLFKSSLQDPPFPQNPVRTYPFNLDPFQRMSIACIERGESVLVSAHTSAGKTVVAEYAIAKSLGANQRVIYTSPIKALSNQKYRELFEEFSDVGLMTGDTTINPTAGCLVMTTEVHEDSHYI